MSVILHFQESLQKRLCCSGRSEDVILNRSEVTCKNCLGKLKLTVRQKFMAKIDWNALYVNLSDQKLPLIKKALREFLFQHPQYKAECDIGNYPPHVWISFWVPANGDKRRKTIGMYDGKDSLRGSVTQVFIPSESDMDTIATFVGATADNHSLKARRTERDSACLNYELKQKVGLRP